MVPSNEAHYSYSGVIQAFSRNKRNARVLSAGLKSVLTNMGFHQIHFYCYKKSVGRVVSIVTKNNTAGQQVVRFFTDDAFAHTNLPAACGSFYRLPEDKSVLGSNCLNWGADRKGDVQVNKWGCFGLHGSDRLGILPFMMDAPTKHGILFWQGSFPSLACDDSYNSPKALNAKDIWSISVR